MHELNVNYDIDILYNKLSSEDFIRFLCKRHYLEIINLDDNKRDIYVKVLLNNIQYMSYEILSLVNINSVNFNIIQKNKIEEDKKVITYTVNGINGLEETVFNDLFSKFYYRFKIVLKKMDDNNTIIKVKNINNELSADDNIILGAVLQLLNNYFSNILTNIFINTYFKKVNIYMNTIK